MKKFITNNWKKILVCIGAIFIIINVFTKITVDKTLLADYIKYGKNIEKSDIVGNVAEVVTPPEAPFGPEIVKFVCILGALILLIVFITSLGDRAAAKAKKK